MASKLTLHHQVQDRQIFQLTSNQKPLTIYNHLFLLLCQADVPLKLYLQLYIPYIHIHN